ncbi:GNAT family N-acetyltransferase [Paenibacillus albiflavus]|uniref:GNAT family N-acetyltransferase n=1 Tax=Paenibacillus albiflavus TaxID=2545760 RepID=A0A4R4EKG3_9BACL|nr:GNAT family N-acetyltransferase [Paenibacillus albiflavus]
MVYLDSLDQITEDQLDSGFFDGWPNPPSVRNFYKILENSSYIQLALDVESNKVIGFINALSDQVLAAYIPLLEVIPAYKNQGIGTILVERMLEKLQDYYMIDLLCDEELQAYYTKRGLIKASGMMKRNYQNQSGIQV